MDSSIFSNSTKMPHKIVIIDDRPNRPLLHLSEESFQTLKELPNVQFVTSKEEVDCSQFDVIAIHRSYVVSANLGDEFDNLIKNNSKYVVFFSGGVSQQTITDKGHKAILGSEVFYSPNLLPFCEDLDSDEDVQLYKLLYGIDSWRLPIMLRLRQLYWLDPDEDDTDIDDEKEEIQESLGIDTVDELEKEIKKLIVTV